MSRRRGILAVLLATAALALSACAGLPTSGPVNPGLPAGADAGPPDFSFRPDSPQPGATPEQIVAGFIRAGSGPADNWAVAREYLAPSAEWNPNAGVTIDVESDRVYASPTEDQVVLTLTAVALTDATGAFSPEDAGSTTLPFRLAKQDDGEWRITEARDGLVLDRDQFASVFHRYSLMFFDPTWSFLVPDVRWFPAVNAPTHVADALVEGGPSPWLAGAAATAFPADVTLARPSVPVIDGVARVELDDSVLKSTPDALSRMQAQLQASLTGVSGVSAVEMSVSSTPLVVDPAKTRTTRVGALPVVVTADGFGTLSGDQLQPIAGLSDAMTQVDPTAIQVAPDADFAGVLLSNGSVARVPASGGAAVYDTRPGLIAPTVDASGYVWSVPHDAPAALQAFSRAGDRIDIADAWPEATAISAMSLSRDGSRLAAVVTSGGRQAVWIAGVVRDVKGVPSALGVPVPLEDLPDAGAAIAWLDDITLGVLTHGSDAPEVIDLIVGGPSASTAAPAGATQLAGANQSSTVRLRGADGELYVKRGSNWTQTGAGILVLATQQGTPR